MGNKASRELESHRIYTKKLTDKLRYVQGAYNNCILYVILSEIEKDAQHDMRSNASLETLIIDFAESKKFAPWQLMLQQYFGGGLPEEIASEILKIRSKTMPPIEDIEIIESAFTNPYIKGLIKFYLDQHQKNQEDVDI